MHSSIKRLAIASAATALLCVLTQAQAQTWPTKTVRFIVPFTPGGANDLMARAAAEGAGKVLGQTVIVENRGGAGGSLGADIVAKSTPDGYTFLISAAGVISNSMIKKSLPFKDEDLMPVVMIGVAPSVIVVPKAAPMKHCVISSKPPKKAKASTSPRPVQAAHRTSSRKC